VIDAEVDGAAAFATSLASAAASLADLTDAGAAAGAVVVKTAQARTPRRTGRLAASASIDPAAQIVTVTWGTSYAAYVNFGTRRMVARPFATDALEAAEAQVGAIYATAVGDVLAAVHT
jgi:HK97 gp10 family phage protein